MSGRERREKRLYIRQIEYVMYHEGAIREAIREAREYTAAPEIRNGSGLSDPTASAAIRAIMPLKSVEVMGEELKNPERWVEVVDKAYGWSRRQEDYVYEVARRRYRGEFYRKTCRELAISESLYYGTIERFRIYAALQAVQLGLIRVDMD